VLICRDWMLKSITGDTVECRYQCWCQILVPLLVSIQDSDVKLVLKADGGAAARISEVSSTGDDAGVDYRCRVPVSNTHVECRCRCRCRMCGVPVWSAGVEYRCRVPVSNTGVECWCRCWCRIPVSSARVATRLSQYSRC